MNAKDILSRCVGLAVVGACSIGEELVEAAVFEAQRDSMGSY